MKQNEKWLNWAVELQALAQTGLYYGGTVYDKERYARIREIAAEMMAYQSETPMEKVRDLFCNEDGYQTPKMETRAAIFRDGKILLVHETGGGWVLPGGWVDVDCSIKENTVKEVQEEAGLEVTADIIIAAQDRDQHNCRPYPWKVCKIFVLCHLLGGEFRPNSETDDSGFFSMEDLPPLALNKNTPEQIQMCFDAYHADHWTTRFD